MHVNYSKFTTPLMAASDLTNEEFDFLFHLFSK
jgi:hypothetical protein